MLMTTRPAKQFLKSSAARVRAKEMLKTREQLIQDGICIGCQAEPAMAEAEFGANCNRKRMAADAVAMKNIFLEFARGWKR